MKFYSKVASLTIPLPTIQNTQNINGQNVIQNVSPGTVKFERGVYDTKAHKHLMSEEKLIAFIKGTSLFGTDIFESPEPVKVAAQKRSEIVGAQATNQVLVNRDTLPINQVAKEDVLQRPDVSPVQSLPSIHPAEVKEFESRNDLVLYLINEKGVKSEDLKGKKGHEVVSYAKEVHGIDAVIKPV